MDDNCLVYLRVAGRGGRVYADECVRASGKSVGLFRAFPISRMRERAREAALACLAGWANYTMTAPPPLPPPRRQNSRCLRNSRGGRERGDEKSRILRGWNWISLFLAPESRGRKAGAFSLSLSYSLERANKQSRERETKSSTTFFLGCRSVTSNRWHAVL